MLRPDRRRLVVGLAVVLAAAPACQSPVGQRWSASPTADAGPDPATAVARRSALRPVYGGNRGAGPIISALLQPRQLFLSGYAGAKYPTTGPLNPTVYRSPKVTVTEPAVDAR